jgi:hypothetical protein
MERFNWIWKTLQTLSVVVCIGGVPGQTSALPATDGGGTWGALIDVCMLSYYSDGIGNAQMYLTTNSNDQIIGYAGANRWKNGAVDGGVEGGDITREKIATCLNRGEATVTSFTVKGADGGGSYADQVYMGISFTLSEPVAGFAKDVTHGFYIGTAPTQVAGAPSTLLAVPDDDQVEITFTAPSSDGGAEITDYEYQLDGGTWTSAGTASSPVMITGLTNGTSYSIKLRAVNSEGEGAESAAVTSTPATTPDAPTALVATPGDAQVSVAFQVPSSDGGAAITDYEYQLDGGTWTSASTTSSPVVITGLTNGTSYSIKLRAVNSELHGAESVAVSVLLGSPTSAFEEAEAEVQAIITRDAIRSLNSTLASNTRLTRDARGRFLTSRAQMQSDEAGLASRNTIALDVDGTAVASADQIATQGMFFAQTGNFEGTERRLVFGDFDVQRDGETGSTTVTINGRIAWEQMLSEQTMLGYYLGGEVARSNIQGSFIGTQGKYGVSSGGYFMHALQENLLLDGFASLGAGRNNLEIADDTLDLTSDYTTQTVTLGAAVSGVIEQAGYDILPELSVAYGRTSIGNVGFTGVAYELTDDTLSLDAGSVSTATIMFRPEFRVPMDKMAASESSSVFSFAPRVMCERVKVASTTNNCGGGAEIGFSSSSSDGLTLVNATIIADRVGNSTRGSLQLHLQHRF